jgi:hypothetical protein
VGMRVFGRRSLAKEDMLGYGAKRRVRCRIECTREFVRSVVVVIESMTTLILNAGFCRLKCNERNVHISIVERCKRAGIWFWTWALMMDLVAHPKWLVRWR